MRRPSRPVICALAALAIASLSAGGVLANNDRHPRWISINATGVIDLTTGSSGARKCLPSGQCSQIAFISGTLSGDITGDIQFASSLAFKPGSGSFNGGSSLISGTVKGCGVGVFAVTTAATWLDPRYPATPQAVPSRYEVLRGLGSGDLAAMEGEGILLAQVGPTRIDLQLMGRMRCQPSAKSDGDAGSDGS